MKKTVVINIVGLASKLIGEHTPFLNDWNTKNPFRPVKPVLPAVTCSAQSTYLTGKVPGDHGIVGNGWYFKTECEVKFWRQSNKLVQAAKIWDWAKNEDPDFTCANMFWWYNMYSSVDFSVTPRPNYLANGLKIPDIYSYPSDLRDKLQQQLGQFPLFDFWGPKTSIKSSQWIAQASIQTDQLYDPTLTLVYLPHLDYNLQRHGHHHPSISTDLNEIDAVCKNLVDYYESRDANIILLSGYGITDVNQPIHLNRLFREKGWLDIRKEQTWELLDAGASQVFAVADHQIAHIYLNDQSKIHEVRSLLEQTPGIERVLGKPEKQISGLDHVRAGDLVAIADRDSWFTYYYWLDDSKAPDFARTVDIHKKPGYDPVEMFIDPTIKIPLLKVGSKLLRKKLGFRYLMDVIPLDANLIKGSHGRIPEDQIDWPLISSTSPELLGENPFINSTAIFGVMQRHLQGS